VRPEPEREPELERERMPEPGWEHTPEPGWEHTPELPPGLVGQSLELAPCGREPGLVRALAPVQGSRALPAEPRVLEPVQAVVPWGLLAEPPGPEPVLARALRLALAVPRALSAELSARAPERVSGLPPARPRVPRLARMRMPAWAQPEVAVRAGRGAQPPMP